ncbi:3382_t:CDS:2, partial [Gigaspora margarita]
GFVNVDSKEMAQKWFKAFESHLKTTMPQTKGYIVKGIRVLFREKRHCAHSSEVKKKKAIVKPKIHNHPLEINIKFIHNHIIDSEELLSFRHELHLHATNDSELLELLADRSTNPDYNYVSSQTIQDGRKGSTIKKEHNLAKNIQTIN